MSLISTLSASIAQRHRRLFCEPDQFTSWSLGIFVSGLVRAMALGAESIVWTLMFRRHAAGVHLLSGDGAAALAAICRLTLPPTYAFGECRSLLMDHVFRADLNDRGAADHVVLFIAYLRYFCAFAHARATVRCPGRRISNFILNLRDLGFHRRRDTYLLIDAL